VKLKGYLSFKIQFISSIRILDLFSDLTSDINILKHYGLLVSLFTSIST